MSRYWYGKGGATPRHSVCNFFGELTDRERTAKCGPFWFSAVLHEVKLSFW